ncbi:MAG: peptide chain release factor 2, partial [Candidatus Phytoplasma stylosanthis]|nr:peptide chain release factor 2 [Candidatus Phytoplasma stylosanthis]
MEQYEINKTLENLKTILLNLETKINLSEQKKKIVDFKKLIIETSFWDTKEDLIKINKQIHRIQEKINLFSELKK